MSRIKSTIDPGTPVASQDPATPIFEPGRPLEDLAVGDPAQE